MSGYTCCNTTCLVFGTSKTMRRLSLRKIGLEKLGKLRVYSDAEVGPKCLGFGDYSEIETSEFRV
jgi:hypothetical protein